MADTMTPEVARALLAFLPGFETPGRTWGEWRNPPVERENGRVILSLWAQFDYDADVDAFMALVSDADVLDGDYDPERAGKRLARKNPWKGVDVAQWREMFTMLCRSEHWGAGGWQSHLERGNFQKALRRLAELFPGENAG